MVSAPLTQESLRARAARYSEAQRRTIAVALDLFAEHGVGGTSLQMIADRLGVTKAAVYYQFRAKDEIVVAVLETRLAEIEDLIETVESGGATRAAREDLLGQLIDGAVTRRRAIGAIQNDPVFVRFVENDPVSRRLWARLFSVLLGEEPSDRHRVRAAVLSAAIGSAGHAFVARLDDDGLRRELLAATRPLLRQSGPADRRRH